MEDEFLPNHALPMVELMDPVTIEKNERMELTVGYSASLLIWVRLAILAAGADVGAPAPTNALVEADGIMRSLRGGIMSALSADKPDKPDDPCLLWLLSVPKCLAIIMSVESTELTSMS